MDNQQTNMYNSKLAIKMNIALEVQNKGNNANRMAYPWQGENKLLLKR